MFNIFRRKKEKKDSLVPDKEVLLEEELQHEEKLFLEEEKRTLFSRFKEGLNKTKEKLSQALESLIQVDKIITPADLEELEEKFILADLGVETTFKILEPLRRELRLNKTLTASEVKRKIKESLYQLLVEPKRPFPPLGKPAVLFFLGINGVGKTTTIAKLAKNFKDGAYKVMMIAGDTFRAGAIEQLQKWGEKLGIVVFSLKEGADPSAVIYQGIEKAIKENYELVLVDTAGRLHTKYNLMEELKKMVRVMEKLIPQEAIENILVLDANTGQNALSQAEHFTKAIPVHSVILTKLDGTAKGGIAFAVSHKFSLPIRFIGLGEKPEDLLPFSRDAFVQAILPNEN